MNDADAPEASEACESDFYATRRMWKPNGSNAEFINLQNQPSLLNKIERFLLTLEFNSADIGTCFLVSLITQQQQLILI